MSDPGHPPPPNFVENNEDGGSEEIICTHILQLQNIKLTGNTKSPAASSTTDNARPTSEKNGIGTRDAVIAAGVAGTAGVAAPVVGTAVLSGVGFTGTGVVAGTMAAGVQAGIGNVAAGSLFAACQSVAAIGGFAILGPVGVGAAAVGGLGYLGVRKLRNWWNSGNVETKIQNNPINDENFTSGRSMCSNCRRQLLLRISRNFYISAFEPFHAKL